MSILIPLGCFDVSLQLLVHLIHLLQPFHQIGQLEGELSVLALKLDRLLVVLLTLKNSTGVFYLTATRYALAMAIVERRIQFAILLLNLGNEGILLHYLLARLAYPLDQDAVLFSQSLDCPFGTPVLQG